MTNNFPNAIITIKILIYKLLLFQTNGVENLLKYTNNNNKLLVTKNKITIY